MSLPSISCLAKDAGHYSFQDCRRVPIAGAADASQLLDAFAHAAPPWVDALMRLRNRLVAPFGLKIGTLAEVGPPYAVGQSIGLFRIFHLNPLEAILGEDDRHLDFRISMLCHDGALWGCTLVRPHNRFGRLYLALGMPWHHLIAGAMFRRMAARLNAAVNP